MNYLEQEAKALRERGASPEEICAILRISEARLEQLLLGDSVDSQRKFGGVEFQHLGSVIDNYRRQYKAKFNMELTLTDLQVAEVYDKADAGSSSDEHDEWLLEGLQRLMDNIHTCSQCEEDFQGDGIEKHEERFCGQECLNTWEDEGERYYSPDPDDYLIDGVGFADPGGESALRAATASNPRNLPCPTCEQPNRLTPADRARGYQCDACADRAERGGW